MARRVPASTVCPSPSAKPDLCAVRRVCRALWARTRPTVADSEPIRRRLLPGRSPRSACRVSGSTFFPVVESLLEDFALDAGEQVTGYVGDELGAQRVVPDLPNQGVGLSEVVVLRVQFVGSTHHRSIGLPAVIHRTGQVGERATDRVRRLHRLVAGVLEGHRAVERVVVHRRVRAVDRQLVEVGADPVAEASA